MISFGYARVSTQDQDLSAQVEAWPNFVSSPPTIRRSCSIQNFSSENFRTFIGITFGFRNGPL